MELIPASGCPRCGRVCAPPARYCPDCAEPMTTTELPGYGEVISFTTLYSPPTGFTSPLHLALVELERGAKFLCHGAEIRGLKVGSRVAIEAIDQVYYFSHLGFADRARLFWRRSGQAGAKLSSIARSAVKRLIRRHPSP